MYKENVHMKKYLFALLLGSLLVLALATVAMADNGPHGSFTADTSACAGCHRVHTAQYGSNALLIADPAALCYTCHAGFGAGTNVADGVFVGTGQGTNGASLLGGGFNNALMATLWSGKYFDPAFNATSKPTTSHHDLGTSGTVWGSGANNSTPGTYVLECTSCHDPHGNAGWSANARVASYRLLRWQPQGSNGFTAPPTAVNWSGGNFVDHSGVPTTTVSVSGWLVPDNYSGAEWYTLGNTFAFANGDYSAGGPQSGANPPTGNANGVYLPTGFSYVRSAVDTAFFCAQCHDRYFNNSRLRNATDDSVYCGAPVPKTVNGVVLTVYPPTATGQHPVDPVRCEPVVNATGTLTGWGDNGDSGDTTYHYRHAAGDIRLSMDGTVAAGAGTSISRSCMACHVAHGTTAASNAAASSATLSGDSALLRMDNRSICLRCHASGVNYTIAP
jgi:predicted CXXCH cytochrome family protein